MGKLWLEKLIVYAIAFVTIFSLSFEQNKKIQEKENQLIGTITSFLEDYNYEFKEIDMFSMNSADELLYVQGNNEISFDYDMDGDGLDYLTVSISLYLKTTDDLSDIYDLLSQFGDDNLKIYDSEIQTMINKFIETGEEQEDDDLISNGSLWVNKSYVSGTDYCLHFFKILK